MKKIEKAALFMQENRELFQCPICKDTFDQLEGNSLSCLNGHLFDISKKGTLYFLLKGTKNEYDKEMLSSRFNIATAGLFHPLLDELYKCIIEKEDGHTLDVGCGEGSQLDYLTTLGLKGQKIGFDISKDAIQLAANHFSTAFWCVADLAQSPFASQQYDTILNIFSPSNYKEFDRLLKKGGQVIKVVPEKDYLIELRKLFYRDQAEKQTYSNEVVIEKFKEHFPSMEMKRVNYSFELTQSLFEDLMKMTPLSWGASPSSKEYALAHPLQSVTIDVCVLVGQK
ncbi:ribosomal RNA large subunit methyltransferase A, putative [Carnobacterium sp. AT7]|uniref:methyltransferase domain-containing protein n=1 Tax=Carnobacterium sp. AT7 TaxID=333990 RepID=UPI00015EF70C|nr:methyltransferase domain-containing protein [Carnobacterium sp. AT7]EDP67830.1 ribosomal RNA large subunit methyltransferase A, putative [Carnobacterium sp. AT7]